MKDRFAYFEVFYSVFLFFAIPSNTWLMFTAVVHQWAFMLLSRRIQSKESWGLRSPNTVSGSNPKQHSNVW